MLIVKGDKLKGKNRTIGLAQRDPLEAWVPTNQNKVVLSDYFL